MQKLLRASLLIATLSVLFLIGGSPVVQAQVPPGPATNDILGFYTSGTERAKSYFDSCLENKNFLGTSCTYTADGIDTMCQVVVAGWDCTFTMQSDGSKVLADKNLLVGSQFVNYNSLGVEVGRRDTGVGGDSGTGEGAANLAEASCSEGNLSSCIRNLPGMLFTAIAFLFLTLSGFVLGLAGTVFNWVVIRTVFQFGTYFGTNEGMLIAWGVMRDVANIGLLFGFIFMGVLLILNVEGGGHGHGGGMSAKKAIPRLIIFAVLLNFSLFASQLVIDVANAFSSSFATLAGENCSTGTSTGTDSDDAAQGNEECANIGIAGQVLKVTGLTSLWDNEALDIETGMKNLADRPYSYAVSLIMLSIFVLITAMVLLAGAILLIIRVVILSLLMVTSPVGFAGMAIPKLQGIATMWWSKLMSQAFFAPVYLLLIFISIKLTEGLTDGNATLANALIANEGSSVAGNMQVVMVFLVVIGFMIGSLIAATKIGAMGASFATNAASALAFGTVTRGANFAVGGTANRLRRIQQKTGFGGRAGEVMVNRGLRPLEKANLDLRRIPGMAGGLGAAGISAGAKAAEHATYGDIAHQFSDIKSGKGGQKLHEEYEGEKKMSALDQYHGTGDMDPADKTFLASLSTKELEQLHGIKDGVTTLAENLSSEQFSKLMDSKDLSDLEKGKLKAGRFSKLNTASTDAEIKDLVKNMGKEDFENLPPSLLTPRVLNQLSDKQRDDLAGSKNLSPAQRSVVKASSRPARFESVLKDPTKTPAEKYAHIVGSDGIRSLTVAQVAKLDPTILTDAAVATELTPAMLIKLQDEEKLSADQIAKIGAHIKGTTASAGHAHVANGAGAAYWT